jgi:hypothetical protein
VLATHGLLHHVDAHVGHVQTLVDCRFFGPTSSKESLEKTFLRNSIQHATHDVAGRGSTLLDVIFVGRVL